MIGICITIIYAVYKIVIYKNTGGNRETHEIMKCMFFSSLYLGFACITENILSDYLIIIGIGVVYINGYVMSVVFLIKGDNEIDYEFDNRFLYYLRIFGNIVLLIIAIATFISIK